MGLCPVVRSLSLNFIFHFTWRLKTVPSWPLIQKYHVCRIGCK